MQRVDAPVLLTHYFPMSSLAEIERAADALPPEQKQELLLLLGAQLRAERLKEWAASHEGGPNLPDSSIGRDAIYE